MHALATSSASCCRHSWCLLLGPRGANKPEEEPVWKSVSALKWGQKVLSVCHGEKFLLLVGFLETTFVFLFISPIFSKDCPIYPLEAAQTPQIWVETGAFWFAGWLKETISALFLVPSRIEGPRGSTGTSRGLNANAAQAGQRWGLKRPADLFQGCALLPAGSSAAPHSSSAGLRVPSPNCIPTL